MGPLRHDMGPFSPVMGPLGSGMSPLRPGMGPLRSGDGSSFPRMDPDHTFDAAPMVILVCLRHYRVPPGLGGVPHMICAFSVLR